MAGFVGTGGEEQEDVPMKDVVKTFLTATNDLTMLNGGSEAVESENLELLRKQSRNLFKDFSMIVKNEQDETVCLPAPSPKETVRVFLRVKPKTAEESKYRPPPERKTASSLEPEVCILWENRDAS